MQPFIEYKGIRKSFGDNKVLRGVDLAVAPGESLVILGGSGSGKSVMLKLAIGLLESDGGSIFVEGQEVTGYTEAEWMEVRRKITYVFQWGALFDSMSVFDNVAFPLREQRLCDEKEVARRVGEKLEVVGLQGTERLSPADLSGGMRKRVALARAIVAEPRCILYDEPTSGLDPVTADTINRLIRRLQKMLGVTSVIVTHDIQSMFRVGDRVAFLYEGRMAFVGTPEEARKTDNPVLRGFIEGRSLDEREP
ncbi:MAG: ABC transporter ATP-binding protein [Acidobacteria bacterium]|jgi:phospholipid/cholesterol/gamma-HCH transport system ATP-binding protein|nr:ABC transporter ATP-binding protein [Acidobacteriota bacterium]